MLLLRQVRRLTTVYSFRDRRRYLGEAARVEHRQEIAYAKPAGRHQIEETTGNRNITFTADTFYNPRIGILIWSKQPTS